MSLYDVNVLTGLLTSKGTNHELYNIRMPRVHFPRFTRSDDSRGQGRLMGHSHYSSRFLQCFGSPDYVTEREKTVSPSNYGLAGTYHSALDVIFIDIGGRTSIV